MRPRGESISSPHKTYVGHAGRQKPQCTQSLRYFFSGFGPAVCGIRSDAPHKAARIENAIGIELALDLTHQRPGSTIGPPHIDVFFPWSGRPKHDHAAAGRIYALTQ